MLVLIFGMVWRRTDETVQRLSADSSSHFGAISDWICLFLGTGTVRCGQACSCDFGSQLPILSLRLRSAWRFK